LEILVLSDSRKADGYFSLKRASAGIGKPQFFARKEINKVLKRAEPGSLVYLDLSGLESKQISRHLRILSKSDHLYYGLLDPLSKMNDVAGLFHQGAVDYVDKATIKNGVDLKRVKRVLAYISSTQRAQPQSAEERREEKRREVFRAAYISSGNDWKEIQSGREYTFCLMYVELDGAVEMERMYGRDTLAQALASFRKYVESLVGSYNGRIWIWSGFGGVILFPFNLKQSDALKCGFRLILHKHLYDVEESVFPNFISFRLALSIGNLVYTEVGTGHVISDSLNSIYHLGQQFAKPGNFYITEEALLISHAAFLEFFVDAGEFEGKKIFIMRRPVRPGNVS
jgi:hypothetical protein